VPSKWQLLGDKRCNPNGKNPTDFWIFDAEEEKMEAYLERENSVLEINRISNNNKREKTPHPCQFPEALVERVIKAATNENDIVLDIFNGSGTTTKVADELKRRWIGIDKEETYCRIAKLRVEGNLQRKVINNKVHILNAETANESSETGQQSIFQISNY
jgi:DNA modification methylase